MTTGPAGPDDPSEHDGPSGQNGAAKTATILVVDDEILIRLSLTDHLRDCGFRVLEAGNAEEAQQIFSAAEPIEVMLSDISMPGIDGIALAEWVTAKYPDVHVVLMSGELHSHVKLPGAAYLQKPFALDVVDKLIRQLLANGL
jgi:DNA-binding NtrC family response regulator